MTATKKAMAALILLAGVCASGCAHIYTAHGAYYRVRSGDTLEGIAKRYHASAQDLAEVNNVESSAELKPGTSIYIPGMTPNRFAALLRNNRGAEQPATKRTAKETKERHPTKGEPAGKASGEEILAEDSQAVKTDRGRFAWPIEGEISSLYGMRHGRHHDGIDISAKTGTPVYAAADGEVVYAKRMRGYGNLVLLKHKEDFFTVYAHNSVNLVKVGMKVKKGQMVSRVGRTGRATGPHLHFEVRDGPKARNPLFFLPRNMYAEKAKDLKGVDEEGPEGGPDSADAGEGEEADAKAPQISRGEPHHGKAQAKDP
jgi:lipoprotein NlpD